MTREIQRFTSVLFGWVLRGQNCSRVLCLLVSPTGPHETEGSFSEPHVGEEESEEDSYFVGEGQGEGGEAEGKGRRGSVEEFETDQELGECLVEGRGPESPNRH